ncbi:MAG: acyltransferase [Ilumatobacteraceae bacterium]
MAATAAQESRKLGHRVELDGLRGVAIGVVVLVHLYAPFFSGGSSGVDLFFILSGFLITTLALEEHDRGGLSLAGFFTRRFFRIVPALFTVLAFLLISSWTWLDDIGRTVRTEVLFAATATGNMLPVFHPTLDRPTLGHTWSLAIEEQFYLLWPIVLVLFWRRRRPLDELVRWLVVGAVICFVIGRVILWGIVGYEHWSAMPFMTSDGIVLGAILGIRFHSSATRIAPRNTLVPLIALALLAVDLFGARVYMDHDPLALRPIALRFCWYVVVAAAVEGTLRLAAILRLTILRQLGLISYSLYLWHLCFFHLFVKERYPGVASPVLISLRLILAFSTAILSYFFIERVFIGLGRRINVRRNERRTAVIQNDPRAAPWV